MLGYSLARIAKEFTFERAKDFAGSEFANFVRHDVGQQAKNIARFRSNDLTVKASVGQGNWAAVPWVAFFDNLETDRATKGIYVVFLINPDSQDIFLSLNQGTTAVFEEFGVPKGEAVLRRRADDIRERLQDYLDIFPITKIDLGSDAILPRGYEAGHALGCRYQAETLVARKLEDDLEKILDAYGALLNRGGIEKLDRFFGSEAGKTIEEVRRYVFAKRIERAPHVRKEVLSHLQPICQACGLDPVKHYGFSGSLSKTPLDVHHALPLNQLSEGQTQRYRIPEDFMVLCPTCHRMIHKLTNPNDLFALKRRVKFVHGVLLGS